MITNYIGVIQRRITEEQVDGVMDHTSQGMREAAEYLLDRAAGVAGAHIMDILAAVGL